MLRAQENGDVKKNEPFKILGNVGASANFYSSNENDAFYKNNLTRPSYAWNIYGSLIPKLNELSLPLSFVVNQFGSSNRKPYVQMGISPTYKWARLHIGYCYIPFSPLVFDGQSFKGVGVELNPKFLRLAAFYGTLNKAIKDTGTALGRIQQYSRKGYGVKLGIGNTDRYFDIMYFHAKDDSTDQSFNNAIRPKENAVLGTSFKLTIIKKLVFAGDVAISGLTEDLLSDKRSFDSTSTLSKFVDNFFPYKVSTIANYAGQSSLSFYTRGFNSSLKYRRVQPDFQSLGTPYIVDDIELVSWLNAFSISQGKLNISTNYSQQHNNLSKKRNSELRTQVGNINVNAVLSKHLNLNLTYSGYNITQKDRLKKIVDTAMLQQKINQVNVNPSYSFTTETKIHYISANVNFSSLTDNNNSVLGIKDNNLSSSLNYTLAFVEKSLNFSIDGLFSRYKQKNGTSYSSYGPTIGSSVQLFKKKSLSVQGNFGYLINRFNDSASQSNLTYSANVGYQVKKHSVNLYANYIYTPQNRISELINQTIPYAVSTRNVAGGISYNYSF